ncbi:MAG: peroxide stress protein YaaA [Verrucomicrobiota bacterium]|nr:peroxide stress protein YaaA [Verrucomicrobiota bacterium]|tara:strand:+ start:4288 stop:5043 length:756 start_codon:yes stop_codon:yes gene_type:complete
MILLLSPSKNMKDCAYDNKTSQPVFINEAKSLVNEINKMNISEIQDFMEISEKLAHLNFQRFQNWSLPFNKTNSSPAIYSFSGDVYEGLDAYSLEEEDVKFAQKNLLILSGLYGILKPLDLIQPYRLEMGRKLKYESHKNLYSFWNDKISLYLNNIKDKVIINLASNEYFNVVNKEKISKKIISPIFKDEKNGKFKIISFYAKKARGLMANYIIKNKIDDPSQLIKFNINGYTYNKNLSTDFYPVFTRSAT